MNFFIQLDKLDGKDIDTFIERFKEIYESESIEVALKVAMLTDEQYKRFKKLLNVGINDFVRYEAAMLSEDEYKIFHQMLKD